MFKVNIKTPERRQWRCCCFLLITLKISQTFFSISIVDFEQANFSWVQVSISASSSGFFWYSQRFNKALERAHQI